MTAPAWPELEGLFHEMLARPSATRASFLAERCAGRPELHAQIEAMLRAHDEAQSALDVSPAVTGSLHAGARIGAYEIVGPLGAGGMGEVYRARDTRLGRDVAIKVLPPTFMADSDRLARFRREARVLAALNHPNIAAIYGIEEGPADAGRPVRALVLELVEGETLADRIGHGALPVSDALAIARQIAEALEAAHEKGIVHRDLKPANIKVTPPGVVKVLDFGLAKISAGNDAAGLSQVPNVTADGTQPGVVAGTPAYMSPEQARGSAVDKRNDIWAFGCVLFEMLTGRRAFGAESLADTVVQVMSQEPDWQLLPPRTPRAIRILLQACLQRDQGERIGDIAGALFVLKEVAVLSASEPVVAPSEAPRRGFARTTRRVRRTASVSAVVLLVGAAFGGGVWLAMRAARVPATPVSRFAIALPPSLPYAPYVDRSIAMSPDGTRLVYRSLQGMVARSRDRLDATLLPLGLDPFFSPDGLWIGYTDGRGKLYKVPVTGGLPVVLTETAPGAIGAWTADGIVLADVNGLFRVSSDGGTPERLRMTELEAGEQASFPEPLPGGEILVFTVLPTRRANTNIASAANAAGARIEALDLRTGERKTLVHGGAAARYVPTGHLIYAARGLLYAVAFDIARVEVRGAPVPVASEAGSADFAVSSEGSLVYAMGANERLNRTLVWRDRRGSEESLDAPARPYVYPRVSPDGTRVALVIQTPRADRDIWIWDLRRKVLESFTMDPSDNPVMAWSPDGRRLAFGSARFGGVVNVFWQAADGSGIPERLMESSEIRMPIRFAPDGWLLVGGQAGPWQGGGSDILALSMDGTRRTERIVRGVIADVSPDGRWIAYDSNESGQLEVYVRPYPDTDRGRWVISTGGGRQPLWSRDGRELFYRDFTGAVMAVPVALTPTFVPQPPVKLFEGEGYAGGGSTGSGYTYDLSRDGQRFLMMKESNATAPALVVVSNWHEELKRLVPTR